MRTIRNILALIGLSTLLGGGYAVYKAAPTIAELRPAIMKFYLADLDPKFTQVYFDFAKDLLEHQDPGKAITWTVPVEDGIGIEEVKESLKSIAAEHNFQFVGESPFYKQVENITGKPYRHVSFLSFCNARIGKIMVDYRDSYTGFMPCRIAVVEDKQGKLWLYSMNLDFMIHGGKKLPDDLEEKAIRARNAIRAMMDGAAKGDF
uniref:Uncharacterized conserved protein, DUF302 family n=1 Tax=Candidatus Kentrum sp. LFY TaxID=2126342 RepID=A0A450UTX2_9GAMM|nr:MAG: Uncharacterized conserved protein, DUF302 family [Candidatus Kentron sp. LFY]VFK02277.1 MAG: Uncharacterized conserved protein, DUF302 family [Candidatus Kentron sp. LFY]VFK14863.1 MAG: Uncharacterized conserved protein, DUF302 family [Candidatus Kentron sp. LFY]